MKLENDYLNVKFTCKKLIKNTELILTFPICVLQLYVIYKYQEFFWPNKKKNDWEINFMKYFQVKLKLCKALFQDNSISSCVI